MKNDLSVNNIETMLYDLKGIVNQINDRVSEIIGYIEQFSALEENEDT